MFNALPNSKVLHPVAITVITDFFFLVDSGTLQEEWEPSGVML